MKIIKVGDIKVGNTANETNISKGPQNASEYGVSRTEDGK